ncbi:hypothetical protein PT286_04940 [Neisseriaceae bacterium ESL0693]|nr:hypothetical protein [Neisseriaceae bacterium ESL0693]
MKTYTIDYDLLASSADTLLAFDYFSQHVEIIAEVIETLTRPDDVLVKQLANMLVQMATHMQNCEGGRLAAHLCTVFDENKETKP